MKQTLAAAHKEEMPVYATRKGLAARYSVSLRTIDEWMARGWIPFMRIGGSIRFHVTDVDAAVRERFEVRPKAIQKQ